MSLTNIYTFTAFALIVLGLATVLLRRNLIKMVLGFSLVGTGSHLLIVTLGFVPGGTAPIVDDAAMLSEAGSLLVKTGAVVDPVPQAMVLTAIVIGVGVTGLMLAYVIRLYAQTGSLDVNELARLKW